MRRWSWILTCSAVTVAWISRGARMVMSSFGEGVWPCVLFYLPPHRPSRFAHRLTTGRKFFTLRRGADLNPRAPRRGAGAGVKGTRKMRTLGADRYHFMGAHE